MKSIGEESSFDISFNESHMYFTFSVGNWGFPSSVIYVEKQQLWPWKGKRTRNIPFAMMIIIEIGWKHDQGNNEVKEVHMRGVGQN